MRTRLIHIVTNFRAESCRQQCLQSVKAFVNVFAWRDLRNAWQRVQKACKTLHFFSHRAVYKSRLPLKCLFQRQKAIMWLHEFFSLERIGLWVHGLTQQHEEIYTGVWLINKRKKEKTNIFKKIFYDAYVKINRRHKLKTWLERKSRSASAHTHTHTHTL